MNRDDIIRNYHSVECSDPSGIDNFRFTIEELEQFITLVEGSEQKKLKDQIASKIRIAVINERNACANICAERANGENDAQWCVDAIRSRNNNV